MERTSSTTTRARVDVDAVWGFLSTEAYWGKSRTRADFEAQLATAWRVVGAYEAATGRLVGFARAISDGVAYGYLSDVFVTADARGSGLGKELVATMIDRGPGAGLPLEPAHLRRARPLPPVRLRGPRRAGTWNAPARPDHPRRLLPPLTPSSTAYVNAVSGGRRSSRVRSAGSAFGSARRWRTAVARQAWSIGPAARTNERVNSDCTPRTSAASSPIQAPPRSRRSPRSSPRQRWPARWPRPPSR